MRGNINKQKTIIDRYDSIKVYNADGTKFFFIVTSDRSLNFKDRSNSKQKKVSYDMWLSYEPFCQKLKNILL